MASTVSKKGELIALAVLSKLSGAAHEEHIESCSDCRTIAREDGWSLCYCSFMSRGTHYITHASHGSYFLAKDFKWPIS